VKEKGEEMNRTDKLQKKALNIELKKLRKRELEIEKELLKINPETAQPVKERGNVYSFTDDTEVMVLQPNGTWKPMKEKDNKEDEEENNKDEDNKEDEEVFFDGWGEE